MKTVALLDRLCLLLALAALNLFFAQAVCAAGPSITTGLGYKPMVQQLCAAYAAQTGTQPTEMYSGNIGQHAFIYLKTADGKDIPYGAMVSLNNNTQAQTGIVSDAGMVYLAGLQQTGILKVQWGEGPNQRCHASFNLPDRNGQQARINQTSAICR